jgi:hypothetical protein
MQHEEPGAGRRRYAGDELAPASVGRRDHPRAAGGRHVRRAVRGAAIGDDDLMGNGESRQVLQEPRQTRSLVQRRNDDRQDRAQLRTSVWKRARRSRVTGPDFPAPMSRPSTWRMATTSAAVPVKNASSAV